MTKPQNFIATSDYGSVKNDARGRLSLTIPNGATIPPNGGKTTWSQDLTIGTINASLRTQMQSSLRPGEWTLGQFRTIDMTLNYPGFGTSTESGAASIIRINATTIRLYCTHFNFSPSTITVVGGQTITADVVSFLSPFN